MACTDQAVTCCSTARPIRTQSMSDDKVTHVPNWLFSPAFRGPSDAPPPEVEVTVEFGARSRPEAGDSSGLSCRKTLAQRVTQGGGMAQYTRTSRRYRTKRRSS